MTRLFQMSALRFLWLVSLLFATLQPGTAVAGKSDKIVPGTRELEQKPSAELIGRAASYIEADTLLDRAVAALSVVANRYYAKPEDSTARRDAITALSQLGNIYSLRIFDYPKAYTNLITARMLAEEEGDDYNLALILLRLANIYNICYDEADQNATYELLSKALESAISSHNEEVITCLAMDHAIIRLRKNGWGNHADDIAKIRSYRFPERSQFKTITVNIVEGMDAYFRKDYRTAETLFKRAVATLPPDQSYRERFEYGTMHLLQHVYQRSGNYDAEENLLRTRLKLAKELGHDDYILYTYGQLETFFDRRNRPDSVKKYNYLYLLAKEELEQNSGLSKVKNVDMLRQIEKANDEVRDLSLKRLKERRRMTIAIAISAVALILLLTFVYLFLNLKRNHRLLFQKNRELLDREEQLRMLMAHKDEESPNTTHAEPHPKEDADEGDCETDEANAQLFPRIMKVMEEDHAIYSPGFGIDDLAALLHVPQRGVSRAINACSGMNFHQFLNGYRIREACRLMQTTDPVTTTVEYIAETVGFKSRTSFASLFKKTTGLTPSEYWKMAAKEQ